MLFFRYSDPIVISFICLLLIGAFDFFLMSCVCRGYSYDGIGGCGYDGIGGCGYDGIGGCGNDCVGGCG